MKGISPLVSLVLTVALSTVAVAITLTVILPTMDRVRDSNVIDEALGNLELINDAIRQVSSESEGSRRTIGVGVTDGSYTFDESKDIVYFDYEPKSDFVLEGRIGNVYLERGQVLLEYFNDYPSGSDASPTWKVINGTCKVESGMYYCYNGAAYVNVSNIAQDFKIEGKIIDKSGNGEIYPLTVAPENLVLYLTFDEGSGNETYDYSLNYNNGTLLDANATNADGDTPPQWVDGKFGKALSFDGVDDYVEVPYSDSINLKGAITIEGWAYLESLDGRGISGSKESHYRWLDFEAGTGRYYWHVGNGTRWIFAEYQTWTLPVKEWFHLAYVVDWINGWAKVYLNGVLKSEATFTPGAVQGNANDLFIGSWSPTGYFWFGKNDEVRIYNRALSEAEIKAEYEMGLKRLQTTGKTDWIGHREKIYLVVSNPYGKSYFDDIKVKTVEKKIRLVLPFDRVDINNTLRIGKGNFRLSIAHKGLNPQTNEPIIEIAS